MLMANERESNRVQLAPNDTGLAGSEHEEGRINHPATYSSGRPRTEAIRAVSALLSAKKAVLDSPSTSSSFTLPKISGSFEDIVRHFKSSSNPRAELALPRLSIDIPSMKLPDRISGEGARDSETPSGESLKTDPGAGSRPSPAIEANRELNSSGSMAPPTISETSKPGQLIIGIPQVPKRNEEVKQPDRRVAASIAPVQEVQGSRDTSSGGNSQPDPDHRVMAPVSAVPGGGGGRLEEPAGRARPLHSETGSPGGFTPRQDFSNSSGMESSSDRSRVSSTSKVATINLPREPKGVTTIQEPRHSVEVQRMGMGISSPGKSVDHETDSSNQAEPSTNLVRNPLSAELRNFSLANPAPPENGSALAGQDGMKSSAGETAFGAMSWSPEGSSIDLSKTNELLQQLLDAVRKQSSSFLPISGPSAYLNR